MDWTPSMLAERTARTEMEFGKDPLACHHRELLEGLAARRLIGGGTTRIAEWTTRRASLELLSALRVQRREELFYVFCRLNSDELRGRIEEQITALGLPLLADVLVSEVLAEILDEVLAGPAFEAAALYGNLGRQMGSVLEQTIEDLLCFIPGVGLGSRLGVVDHERVARLKTDSELDRRVTSYGREEGIVLIAQALLRLSVHDRLLLLADRVAAGKSGKFESRGAIAELLSLEGARRRLESELFHTLSWLEQELGAPPSRQADSKGATSP